MQPGVGSVWELREPTELEGLGSRVWGMLGVKAGGSGVEGHPWVVTQDWGKHSRQSSALSSSSSSSPVPLQPSGQARQAWGW